MTCKVLSRFKHWRHLGPILCWWWAIKERVGNLLWVHFHIKIWNFCGHGVFQIQFHLLYQIESNSKGILLISSMNSTLISSFALDNGLSIRYLRVHPSIQFNLSCLVIHFLFPPTQVQIWVWFLKRKRRRRRKKKKF